MNEASISTHRTNDGGVVVGVRGELDVASAGNLRKAILNAVTTWRPPHMVVDLLYVTLLDSAGIGALVAGYHAMRAVGGTFTVSNPNALVQQQLRVTGLTDVLSGVPAPNTGPAPSASRYADPGATPGGW
jgi:anti-anti-sigma factor